MHATQIIVIILYTTIFQVPTHSKYKCNVTQVNGFFFVKMTSMVPTSENGNRVGKNIILECI